MIRKIFNWLIVVLLLPGLTGCNMDLFGVNKIVSVSLQSNTSSLDIDEAGDKIITISASAKTKKGETVSNPDIAWEYDKNVFTALGTPTSTIRLELNTASAGPNNDITGRTVIKGYDRSNPSVFDEVIVNVTGDLQSLWFEDENGNKISSVQLAQKETVHFSIGTYPRSAEGFELIGSTENDEIAQISVDSDQRTMTLRTGVPGQTNVTIDTEKGGFETPLTVIVKDMVLPDTTPSRIIIENGSFISMEPEDAETRLTAVVYDQYSQIMENQALVWETSDPSVVSIRTAGNVAYIAPHKVGSSRITVRIQDQSELYAVCDVSVGSAIADIIISPYTPPQIMMLSAFSLPEEEAQITASMPIGKDAYYIAEYLPSDTEDVGVIWTVDNTDVINIITDNNDEIVGIEAIAEGSANLIATSKVNSRVQSYVTLSVYDPAVDPDLSIRQIKIDPVSSELEENDSLTIKATAIFQDGTEGTVDIQWSTDGSSCVIERTSSDTSEVTVRAKAPGLTTITASALSNPFVSSSSTILVYEEGTQPGTKLQKIVASPSSVTLLPESSIVIELSYLPSKAQSGIEKPTVSTESVSVTKYDENSVTIKAISPGNSTVTITSSENPSISTRVSARVLSEEEAKQISYLSLDKSSFTLKVGSAQKVKASAHLVDGTIINNLPINWTVEEGSDKVEITGSTEATITGKKEGEAIIKAALESNPGITARCIVTVYETEIPSQPSEKVTRLIPSVDTITLVEGKEGRVSISYLPYGTEQKGLVWTQSNGSVAYLNGDDDGVTIEAIEKGTTTVRATSTSNTAVSTQIKVNVITEEESYLPSYITLSENTLVMEPGRTETITAHAFNIIDQELVDEVVEWTIESGDEVIEITPYENDLRISTKKEGFATVKASLADYPEIAAFCEIKVAGEDSDPSVELQALIPSTRTLLLVENSSEDVLVSYLPANTYQKGINWSSSSNSISVSGSDEGATIKAGRKTEDTVTVTATSTANPDISADISIKVYTEEEAARLVSKIEFQNSLIEINPPYSSDEIPVLATAFDSSGNVIQDNFIWTVSQAKSVISLREGTNGQAFFSVKNPGEATIKAQSRLNPNVSATCRVVVNGELESISISPSAIELYKNGKAVLRAEFSPADSVNKEIVWEEYSADGTPRVQISPSYTNPTSATITGLESGETEVRAISKLDGKIYGTANVKVLPQALPDGTMPQSIKINPGNVTIAPPFATQIVEATVYGTNGAVYPIGVNWTIENGNTVDSSEPIAQLSPTGEFGVRITPVMAGEATITATSKVDESIFASIPLIIEGAISSIQFIDLPDGNTQLIEVVNGSVAQVQVKLSSANGGETVETDLEWYEDGFVPVYDEDGKISGYDTDNDGQADADQSEMHVSLSPTQSGGIYGCSIKAEKEGTITLVCRSKKRPTVQAKLTVNIVPQKQVTGRISISPTEINMAPDDDKMLITAKIETDEPYVFSAEPEIEMSVDREGLLEFSSPLWSQDGTVFTQYASPGKIPGEGYLTVSLPEYPGIKAARGRVSLGGELTGLKPHNPEGDDDVLIISKGDVVSLGVEYIPSNTTEKGIKWTSTDTNIVKVSSSADSTRAIVSGVGVGTTTVIAESIEHPGIEGIRYVFTVTVKPVVESVTFSYTNPETGGTTTGLTFNINNDSPMELRCNIFPEILDDTTQLIVTPHNEITGSDQSMPSMKLINGTVNDYIFTPADGVIGSYQYDILQQGDGLSGEVIDVLTINVLTESTTFGINDSGQEFLYDGNPTPYVFNKDNPSTEILAYIYDSQLQPLANVEWKSSNINVVRVVDNKDNTVTLQMRYPTNRDKCAGHAVITATVGNGDSIVSYSFDIYVGSEIPDTLWEALSTLSPFKDNPVFMKYKVFYPEMAKGVKSLDFSNFESTTGNALVINDGTDCYLNSDLFPDLEYLNLSNCRLSSSTLSLKGCDKLTTLIAEQPSSGGIDTYRISELKSVPASMKEVDLDNNLLETTSGFSNASLETLSLQNNQITSFRSSSFQQTIKTLKLSGNNNLESVDLTLGVDVEINNCPKLTKLTVNAPFLETLSAYNGALTTLDIDVNTSSLNYLDVHDNKLGTGKIILGNFSYNNGKWTGDDWKAGNNIQTFIAYGNAVVRNVSASEVHNGKSSAQASLRMGSSIPASSIVAEVYSYGMHDGGLTLGTWMQVYFSLGDYSKTTKRKCGSNGYVYLDNTKGKAIKYSDIGKYSNTVTKLLTYGDRVYSKDYGVYARANANYYPFGK